MATVRHPAGATITHKQASGEGAAIEASITAGQRRDQDAAAAANVAATSVDSLVELIARALIGDDSELSDDQGIGLSLPSSLGGSVGSSVGSSVEELSPASDVGDNPFEFREPDVGALLASLVDEMALDLRKSTKLKRFSADEDDLEKGAIDDIVPDGCQVDGSVGQRAGRVRPYEEDPSDVALDLTSRSRSAFTPIRSRPPAALPPLPALMPVGAQGVIVSAARANGEPSEAIKHLSGQERAHLRHAYYRVARFLQLDVTDGKRFPEDFRRMALRRLQAFLYMYLDEVKKKSPAGLGMFEHSFGSDRSIRQFFRVFLGKSEQLGRPVVRQARFATDEGPPQILCRGPTHHERQHNRSASLSNAPYPMRQHRDPYAPGLAAASSAGPGAQLPAAHGWRNALSVHQHAFAQATGWYGQQALGYRPLVQPAQPQQALQPEQKLDVPMESAPSTSTYEDLNVQEVIDIVCKLFPLDDKVKGLTLPDFAELYGVDVFMGNDLAGAASGAPMDDAVMAPSPGGSSSACRTPLYAPDSFPGSPASPAPQALAQQMQQQLAASFASHQAALMSAWSPSSSTCSLPPSPRCASAQPATNSVFMSPPPSSATSSPAPGSPLPRSVESQMTRMSLITSGPPALIPLSHSAVPTKVIQAAGQPSPRLPGNAEMAGAGRSPRQVPSPPQQQSLPSPSASSSSTSSSSSSSSSKVHSLFPPVAPLPFRTAVEEMTASLNPAVKEHSMRQVVKSSMDALTSADEDGDTPLMVACANPAYRNEDLYALVERLKSHPEPAKVFGAVNKKRETALFLAACERRPLVAGYLAETMAALRIPLNQTYQKGNTIIHYLAMWGDECSEVLQYLVRVRTPDDKPAFDLNALNHMGRSALHEAATNYQASDPVGEGFTKCIQLLLDHGADAGLSDITSGKTPVHIAIEKRDAALLELLVAKCPKAANAPMYNDNRPLHSAATLTGVTDAQQLELVNILLKFGADKALRNKANKLPIELVQQDRDRVKAVLQARSRQNQYGI